MLRTPPGRRSNEAAAKQQGCLCVYVCVCVVASGTVTLSELNPGQQYTVHLSAGNDVGFGPSVKFIVNTPTLEQSGTVTSHHSPSPHCCARFVVDLIQNWHVSAVWTELGLRCRCCDSVLWAKTSPVLIIAHVGDFVE